MREGISASLELDEDLELLAACGTYDELMAAVAEHRPDVVLTDIRMPPTQTDGLRRRRCRADDRAIATPSLDHSAGG